MQPLQTAIVGGVRNPLLLLLLRGIFRELAYAGKLPELAYLLRREDVPRAPHRLPRPLTAEQGYPARLTSPQ